MNYTTLTENMEGGEDNGAENTGEDAGAENTGEAAGAENTGEDAGAENTGEDAGAENTGEDAGAENTGEDAGTEDADAEDTVAENAREDAAADILKEKIFTLNNLYLILIFIIIYIVAYFVLGMFTNQGSSGREMTFSYIIDLLISTIFIVAFLAFYFSLNEEKQYTFMKERWENIKEYVKDDYAWVYQLGYIIILYTVVYIFRIPMTRGVKPVSIYLLETIGWLTFMLILAYILFKVAFDVSLFDDFEKIFKIPTESTLPVPDPEIDVSGNTLLVDGGPKKEVFNFSNNKYNYEDAQAICKAYGADIATYDQIEESYNNGGEWCNYGWSANQMAYFPTQKDTWNKLQSTNKHKNACGRPGVNGGYMANPNIKFGVNCYGVKPDAKKCNLDKLSTSGPHIPMNEEEKKMNEKVEYWKENGEKCLNMNSFNYNKWSTKN